VRLESDTPDLVEGSKSSGASPSIGTSSLRSNAGFAGHHSAPVRCETVSMATFVFRLKAPRPTFALDMNDEEREIMGQHAAYWQPYIESGQMVIFGPVLDGTGSWGLGVVEADDEEELRAFAARDPVVTSGIGSVEVGRLLAGFVRSSLGR